ncbi:hypothetical protein PYCCODRAFT_1459906 [Trametes coccinea BRFM310]|uniref:Protein kinase domain-containing protein n=1 Tax=Trametes coccinea (strain BRFM310) TaxID=1353009 RepID=A0A1Y2IIR8_TRAC3|nr:hypothetical protein PYCCODRAFT_1459906 [Trametes coccinea BRFM310]
MSDRSDTPPDSQDRRVRAVRLTYTRDPDGPVLEKNKAPIGHRTPNGYIWAHFVSEFVYIPRVPSIPQYVTTWSRSMLKILDEHYDEVEPMWPTPLVPPRIVRPWPVLKLPLDHPAQTDPPIGSIDEGCEFEHSEFMCYAIRGDSPHGVELIDSDNRMPLRIPRRCPTGTSQVCPGRVLPNVGVDAVCDGDGRPYDFLWCPHFRALCEGKDDNECTQLRSQAVQEMSAPRILADETGVQFLTPAWPPFSGATGQPPDHPSASQRDNLVTPDENSEQTEMDTSAEQEDQGCKENTTSATGVDMSEAADQALLEPNISSEMEQEDESDQKIAKDTVQQVDQFSTTGLPKLEEFIPDSFFPDILLVHDPDRRTQHQQPIDKPVKFRRVLSPFQDEVGTIYRASPRSSGRQDAPDGVPAPERVAHLYLKERNRMGTGHHSAIYRAPFTLPPPLTAHSPTGQVTVAAKLAFPQCTAHTLLHNEARTYATFPKHMQEEYCGYNVVPPCHYPVPVGPIVPKFYGFYLPVGDDGEIVDDQARVGRKHRMCYEDRACQVPWVSPILLLEECGNPVKPRKFTVDQRTECFSQVLRLHDLGIQQGSFYVRNILIQPGPLSAPPTQRTFDRPSFRIIDFGRARVLRDMLERACAEEAREAEERKRERESKKAESGNDAEEEKKAQEYDDEQREAARRRVFGEMRTLLHLEEQQARSELHIEEMGF